MTDLREVLSSIPAELLESAGMGSKFTPDRHCALLKIQCTDLELSVLDQEPVVLRTILSSAR